MIGNLNAQQILSAAEGGGLVIDSKIRNSIEENVCFLQSATRANPHLTLKELFETLKHLPYRV